MATPIVDLTARDLVANKQPRLSPDDTVTRAVELLTKTGVSNLPVVEGKQLVGIISEWDCLKLLSADRHSDLFERPQENVRSVMSTRLQTIDGSASVQKLTHVFVTGRYHRVPVVDGTGALLGMIGRNDVLRGLKRLRTQANKRDRYPDYRRPQ